MLEFVVIHRWFMYSNTVTEGGGYSQQISLLERNDRTGCGSSRIQRVRALS